MTASNWELPMARLKDWNLASTKELERPWEQLREKSRAGRKVPGKAYCSAIHWAIHSVLQWAQYSDRTTDRRSEAMRVAQ
jgi:hypothetical protein